MFPPSALGIVELQRPFLCLEVDRLLEVVPGVCLPQRLAFRFLRAMLQWILMVRLESPVFGSQEQQQLSSIANPLVFWISGDCSNG